MARVLREEAEALRRRYDELIRVIGHMLRTPSSAITGFAELARMKACSEPEHREYAPVILEESRRITRVLDDFRELWRERRGVDDSPGRTAIHHFGG